MADSRLFTLQVPAGDDYVTIPPLPLPANVRITMAAIDPTATPQGDGPKLSTLKITHRPVQHEFGLEDYLDDYEESDEDDEDEDDEDESDEDESKAARKKKAAKEIQALLDETTAMEVDSSVIETVGKSSKAEKKKAGKAKQDEEEEEEDSEEDSDDDSDDEEQGIEEAVICTLDPTKLYQQPLDIVIGNEEEVLFKASGAFTIYLSGNYMPVDEDDESDYDSDVDLTPDEDEEDYYLNGVDDSEDESDELDDLADPRISEVTSDDEKNAPVLSKKEKKTAAKAAHDAAKQVEKIVASTEKAGKKRTADAMDVDVKTAKVVEANGTQTTTTVATATAAVDASPVLSKKQLKKLKANNGEAAQPPTPSSDKKKVQFAEKLETGPTPNGTKTAAAEKTEKSDKKAAAAPAKADKPSKEAETRVVSGVTIYDKKSGDGPSAKSGNRVSMRYIGKLTNGKTFDSNTKGKPFSFKLGAGEVIKGWDIGIVGMKAGGERKLTIPANLAYGSQGMPGIPKNSVLVFEVKLLEIK